MLITHDSAPLPTFQILATRMMPRLPYSQVAPEIKPLRAETQDPGVALEDWDLLFGAVTERLQRTMDALLAATADVPGAGPAAVAARTSVLECVQALTQLRMTVLDAWNNARP